MSCKCIKLTPQECKEFAMWFAVNWEYHDSTSDGNIYISKTGSKVTSSIDDIFDRWLNS